jgi:hypothetical protein
MVQKYEASFLKHGVGALTCVVREVEDGSVAAYCYHLGEAERIATALNAAEAIVALTRKQDAENDKLADVCDCHDECPGHACRCDCHGSEVTN